VTQFWSLLIPRPTVISNLMYRTDGKAQNFILNLFQSFGKAFNPVCTQPTVKHSKESADRHTVGSWGQMTGLV